MIKEIDVKPGWGFTMGINMGANFTILDFGLHWHPKPEEEAMLTRDDMCNFRAGVYLTVCNISFQFGRFWHIRERQAVAENVTE